MPARRSRSPCSRGHSPKRCNNESSPRPDADAEAASRRAEFRAAWHASGAGVLARICPRQNEQWRPPPRCRTSPGPFSTERSQAGWRPAVQRGMCPAPELGILSFSSARRQRKQSKGSAYSSRNVTSMIAETSTAWPFRKPGWKRHCCTASMAFSSRPRPSGWRISMSRTEPSFWTTSLSVTVP